jgi:hypothetical protein
MPNDLAIPSPVGAITTGSGFLLPAVIADQGDKAAERFFTFFTDTIPNANTRAAYYRNALRFFAWTHAKGLSLPAIKSYHVSAYLADLAAGHATPTVKQHLASLRMLFDWLIRVKLSTQSVWPMPKLVDYERVMDLAGVGQGFKKALSLRYIPG